LYEWRCPPAWQGLHLPARRTAPPCCPLPIAALAALPTRHPNSAGPSGPQRPLWLWALSSTAVLAPAPNAKPAPLISTLHSLLRRPCRGRQCRAVSRTPPPRPHTLLHHLPAALLLHIHFQAQQQGGSIFLRLFRRRELNLEPPPPPTCFWSELETQCATSFFVFLGGGGGGSPGADSKPANGLWHRQRIGVPKSRSTRRHAT
jgi:hypothetical protein